ncbi:uncharacterized protein LOC117342806 [Pecten maximus]|uniref:uncharacterized protein LOC117342806 n=1 Tax=Pecten maximus TaxID=6579 RepID=UPI001457FB9B|nr:uncharacterized protein LOC117342806 [Pecten maximus]
MKADRDAGTQNIFTPWRLDHYSSPAMDKHDATTEETTYGGKGHLKSNNDNKPVFSPWEQEKFNYLSIKRNLLSSTQNANSSGDHCEKIPLNGENPSCDRGFNDSGKDINSGNQRELGDTNTRTDKLCQNGTGFTDTGGKLPQNKTEYKDTDKRADNSCQNKTESRDTEKRADNSCQSKIEFTDTDKRADDSIEDKTYFKSNTFSNTYMNEGPHDIQTMDQGHREIALNSDKENQEKRSVESSDSNTENKENFTSSHSPGSDLNNKSPQVCCNNDDDAYEPLNKLSKVSNVLNNSVENLMQYAEVLYKCKLCTTLPSILTSRDSFLSHVSEEHLPNNDQLKECGRCCLRFGTVEDLRAHVSSEHKNAWDEKPQDKIIKKCQKIPNRVPPGFKSRDNFKGQKRSPSFLRSDSDDLETGSQKLVEDVAVADDQETAPHPPKLVITHGVERSVHLAPTQNMTHLQKLTDQIIASNKPDKDGSQNLSPNTNPIIMTPCYTAEFGQFTKLVREGGNIVYFCQLCNWKSQVKMQFQAHCSSSHHTNKVKAADQTDPEESGVTLSTDTKCQKSEKRSAEYKEPVGWTPRGHMSFLTETSGFHIGNSLSKMDNDYGHLKEKATVSKTDEDKMKAEMNSIDKIKDAAKSEKNKEKKMPVGEDDERDKEYRVDDTADKADDANKKEDKELVRVKQNKRKRAAPVVLRNQADCAEGWGSDECDEYDSDVSTGSPHKPGVCGKRRLLGKTRDPEEGKHCHRSSRREGDQSSPKNDKFYPRGPWEREDESWSPHTEDVSIIRTSSPNPPGSGLRPTPPPVVNMYPDHTTPLKYTGAGVQEEEMEKTASMIRQYFESQLGFRGLDRPIKCPSAADWPIPPQTSNRNGEHNSSSSGHGSGYCARDPMYMYNCSLCDFGCADMSEYRLHFDTEHGQSIEMESGDAVADGRGESWKMWKIKEILPDLICVYPRGNVSRDLLLQKISVILSLPEATQWGPACNKAVREQFPHSLAQRKGKYKKTFFFGVALNEHVQEQEEVSDGEGVTYQPLRDMSQDMEKILGHLHSLVQWTGDLESGVSRDEILELLKGRIEEPDVQHWGVQCNRAIRVLFPNVEMKRKGKYKTYPLVNYISIHQSRLTKVDV